MKHCRTFALMKVVFVFSFLFMVAGGESHSIASYVCEVISTSIFMLAALHGNGCCCMIINRK